MYIYMYIYIYIYIFEISDLNVNRLPIFTRGMNITSITRLLDRLICSFAKKGVRMQKFHSSLFFLLSRFPFAENDN